MLNRSIYNIVCMTQIQQTVYDKSGIRKDNGKLSRQNVNMKAF